MEDNKVQTLTLKQAIDNALKGRTQTYIIGELNKLGHSFTDVTFSRKKNGHSRFTITELNSLDKLLESNLESTFFNDAELDFN